MAIGYEGKATVDGNLFLCTGAEIPETMQKLESSAAYGGHLSLTSGPALSTPVAYDYPSYDGSISFDLTYNFLNTLYLWLFSRHISRPIVLYPRRGTTYAYPNCFWTSMNIAASQGGAVNGSMDVMCLTRTATDRVDDYIGNKTGTTTYTSLNNQGIIGALNPDNEDVTPIPYWKTKYEPSFGGEMVSWSMTVQQTVNKFFKCTGNHDQAQSPFAVGIGVCNVSFEADFFFTPISSGEHQMTGTFIAPTPIWESPFISLPVLDLIIGNEDVSKSKTFKMRNLHCQNDNDAVRTGNDLVSAYLQFDVYNMEI